MNEKTSNTQQLINLIFILIAILVTLVLIAVIYKYQLGWLIESYKNPINWESITELKNCWYT